MTVQELILELQKIPGHLQVWVSDANYGEGGVRLKSVEVMDSFIARIDGDEVEDEWVDDEDVDPQTMREKGYNYHEEVGLWSKPIAFIRTSLDHY